jgi:hypothetical protein
MPQEWHQVFHAEFLPSVSRICVDGSIKSAIASVEYTGQYAAALAKKELCQPGSLPIRSYAALICDSNGEGAVRIGLYAAGSRVSSTSSWMLPQ